MKTKLLTTLVVAGVMEAALAVPAIAGDKPKLILQITVDQDVLWLCRG